MGKEHEITSKQAMIFIMSGQIGSGVLSVSSQLAKDAGHDGWISMLIAGAVSTTAMFIIIKLLKRYSNKSIFDINEILYGRVLGKVFSVLIILYMMSLATVAFRLFVEIVKITVLRRTSPIILSFLLVLPSFYLVWHGTKALSRYSTIILFVILTIIILCLSLIKDFKIINLMPVGIAGIKPILGSVPTAIYSYLGLENMAVIYPFIKDKEKAMKYSIAATIITTTFYTFIVIITTGFFGEHMLESMSLPLYSLSRALKVPIFERFDLFFITIWLPAMAGPAHIFLCTSYYSICDMFNINNKAVSLPIYIILIILFGRMAINLNEINKYSGYVSVIGISVIGFLIISYFFSFINRRGVSKK